MLDIKLWSDVTVRRKNSWSWVRCEPRNVTSPSTRPFSPTLGTEKTGQIVTVGEKVPEGRMRGDRGNAAPSPQPSPPH